MIGIVTLLILIFAFCLRYRHRSVLSLAAVILAEIAALTVCIELLIHNYYEQPLSLSWSAVVLTCSVIIWRRSDHDSKKKQPEERSQEKDAYIKLQEKAVQTIFTVVCTLLCRDILFFKYCIFLYSVGEIPQLMAQILIWCHFSGTMDSSIIKSEIHWILSDFKRLPALHGLLSL